MIQPFTDANKENPRWGCAWVTGKRGAILQGQQRIHRRVFRAEPLEVMKVQLWGVWVNPKACCCQKQPAALPASPVKEPGTGSAA